MRENPSLDKKEEVMTFVYAMESDEVAKAATEKKNKINAVKFVSKNIKSVNVGSNVVTAT